MKTDILFSNKSDEYETPQDVFNALDAEFHFNLDPCSTDENHKCQVWFTKGENGLCQDWGGIEYSAIHRIAEYLSGSRSAIRRAAKTERLSLC